MIQPAIIWQDCLAIFSAVPFTLGTAFAILIASILIGMLIAWVRINNIPVAKQIVHFWIHYIRGIPLIIHLYLAYYALTPLVNGLMALLGSTQTLQVSPLAVLIVAYSLYASIGQSENIRGAYLSVDRQQWDASYSVGFTGLQAMRRVILPQGLVVALPVFCNSYLNIIKGLSLAFTIGVSDILARAKICSAQNFCYLEAYIAAGLVYWVLCGSLGYAFQRMERSLKKW